MSSRQRDHKLSKQQAQKTAAKAAQTLLRQRCNQPLALPASMPPLQTLPAEFFYEVAALLPYQSIISLSQVSQAFRQKLSFENGNYTFYQALPAVLLMQEEKNDESASNDNDTAMTDPSSPTQQVAVATRPSPALPLQGLTTPNATFSSLASTSPTQELQSPAISFARLSLATDTDCSAESRLKVLALAGPYEPSLDYRKQILLYTKQGIRCSGCLVQKDSRGKEPQFRWNKLMCNDCFDGYSISQYHLKDLGLPRTLINQIPFVARHDTAEGVFYYRPSVDVFLLLHDQIKAGLTQLVVNYRALNSWKYRATLMTKIEAERRQIRHKVVAAAELLWNGIDPYPVEIKNVFGEVVSYGRNPTVPAADHWAVFRDRFCPTSALKLVLFQKVLLSDKPTLTPVQPGTVWLEDPTSVFKQGDSNRVSNQWITASALAMLYALTDFNNSDYCEEGMGGSCTVWKDLAIDWHTKRLDAELTSQAIIKMQKITPYMRLANDGMHRGIANLRERLGLRRIPKDQQHLSENKAAVRRSVFARLKGYSPDFQHNLAATEGSVNKYFRRIARDACTRCPISSFLFYPVGIPGLLKHMRSHHPQDFWAGHFNLLV